MEGFLDQFYKFLPDLGKQGYLPFLPILGHFKPSWTLHKWVTKRVFPVKDISDLRRAKTSPARNPVVRDSRFPI
jgi:hypothetical protein